MSKPLVIDLCCGLGGWSHGFIAEGWDAIGFDIERHEYGDKRYPGELILADVLTLNGYDLAAANPSALVASPPCQKYSYMAMPFGRGKREARWQRWELSSPFGDRGAGLMALFRACFRIQRELQDALGREVPMVVENVKGAQPWVGRAKWHYGSYYLWGDVPALMPHTFKLVKQPGRNFHFPEKYGIPSPSFHGAGHEPSVAAAMALKNGGNGSWFGIGSPGQTQTMGNPVNAAQRLASLESSRTEEAAMKGTGGGWFEKPYRERGDITGQFNSKSSARKAASAMIAEIPFDLASHVARVFKP